MDLDFLKVVNCEHEKYRLGNKGDGGYVICKNQEYDILISCGIANDISFEEEFTKTYNVNCLAFDGTINNLPETKNEKITFIKKNISNEKTEKTTNLIDYFHKYDNIFLKMDIETWEYLWLENFPIDLLKKVKQLVIEFHFPFTLEPF
jgi:hypothetical protein